MNCLNQLLYTIQYGDSLYKIAMKYNTTVEDILENNTYINPFNLIVGSHIVICPNSMNSNNVINNFGISFEQLKLLEKMNTLWEQHVFWTRLLLISIADDLENLEQTKNRLLKNPLDIANVYRIYYSEDVAQKIDKLLTEHLIIGGDLITALKNKNAELTSNLTQKWYENADDIAQALSSINPYYNEQELRKMLHMHLQLTTAEVSAYLEKNYISDIISFDKVEKEALEMSKYLSEGIIKQFPNVF